MKRDYEDSAQTEQKPEGLTRRCLLSMVSLPALMLPGIARAEVPSKQPISIIPSSRPLNEGVEVGDTISWDCRYLRVNGEMVATVIGAHVPHTLRVRVNYEDTGTFEYGSFHVAIPFRPSDEPVELVCKHAGRIVSFELMGWL